MKLGRSSSKLILKQVIPALAVIAVEKLLELPKVQDAVGDLDQAAKKREHAAMKVVKKAGKNATHNKTLLGASAAAFALGIGLLAKSTQKR